MPSARPTPQRRLVRPATVIGGLLLLLVGMALLAIPFLAAPEHAEGARTDLEAARDSLSAGDVGAADASVRSARRHADRVQDAMQGLGGDLWSLVPIVGEPVADVRHLGNALDHLTAAAEAAVESWPAVSGEDATLFAGRGVDVATLETLVDSVDEASTRLDAAQVELGEVGDSALGVGTRLGDARDEASEVVTPLAATARRARSITDVLPELFGARGERTYLLALLNPSEQRFSGGAPLTVVPMEVSDGSLSMGDAVDTTDPRLFKVGRWDKVEGNPFHDGRLRLSTSTYAPDWSVSGEELLRGWVRRTSQEVDGLVVVDVVALADMLRITGPVETEGYGTLDADGFAARLVGDYDRFPDNEARKDLNRAIVPLFAERLLEPGDGLAKLESLRTSAQGRHFAIWMRDPDVQSAVSDTGLAGELSDTRHDYLAVFNQNTNASKADFWQQRSVTSEVRLREDGSAQVRLTISVLNDSPPYVQPFADPRRGTYVTKWNGMTLGVFLPVGAEVTGATAAGRPQGTRVFDYYGRPYKLLRLTLPPGATREAVLEYDVPAAALAPGDGTLTYRLDATPQGLVVPQAVTVDVRWPDGYEVGELPEGWTRTGPGRASWTDPGLVTQPSFSVTASSVEQTAP
ncbi:hypothetical protein GCM10011376_00710 [Nocardioides flavus (ex Wang et al. 2016)]|uniref:DUF4012 domain-containing protein n=1 Tax=Nocardioides flavus (ex Wang et al. 2016) TaxID=2058780 RepID=A0ABQ3HD08_9ACTN|nr:DUF4012 domain-containing protein [Nocardioides flavus (ex Wang et al. 2016)]GHE14921.1 hypothetical protein GCM10011376_00710 [Nocardioides flavus (ex Wang et al. 2016)]